MARKKKQEQVVVVNDEEYRQSLVELDKEIESNPEYSLQVDPLNKYNMSDLQKKFIEVYCEIKSVPLVADILNIDMNIAMTFFTAYSSKKEIERINKAQLQRRISTKMWDYEKIGGYLTSLLTEENVPLADRLRARDKVSVAGMLINLNEKKAQILQKPIEANSLDLDSQLKELSVDAIKALLEQGDLDDQKKDIVTRIKKKTVLSAEEELLLKSMTLEELLKMVDEL